MKIAKMLIPAALIGVFMISTAQAESMPFLSCNDGSGLPNGLDIALYQEANQTIANISDRIDIGPFQNLGTVVVHRKPVAPGIMGAPETYLGRNFELTINVDVAPSIHGIPSYVRVDIGGKHFSQNMYCEFSSQN